MKGAVAVAALAAIPVVAAQEPPRLRTVAITSVTVIDGTGGAPRKNATVLISGTRIARIADAASREIAADVVVDGRGKFLMPGLWDMHTHLAYVGDLTCSTLVAYGITSVRDPGGNLETIDWLRGRIERGTLIGPRIIRAGPLVDGSKPASQDRLVVDSEDDGRKAVQFLQQRGVDFIKVHTGVPDAPYFAILEEARRRGLAVVGHIPHAVDPAKAVEAGHSSVEHVVSLFEGEVRRKAAAGMSQEQAIAEFTDENAARLGRTMAARGTWFTPTLVTYWYRAHQWDVRAARDPREQYVTGSMRAYWKNFAPLPDEPGVRRALASGFERFVAITSVLHREGVRFLVGTDLATPLTYPGSTVHEELGWLVKAGLSPMEAIVAGTRNGAEAVGRLNELGTIEPGKMADLVLLDADPLADISNTKTIAAVVANGQLFRRSDLDAMLNRVAMHAANR